jgi:hypothetical protein
VLSPATATKRTARKISKSSTAGFSREECPRWDSNPRRAA